MSAQRRVQEQAAFILHHRPFRETPFIDGQQQAFSNGGIFTNSTPVFLADEIRFYWSFRSPYAWFAVHRVEQMLAGQKAVKAFQANHRNQYGNNAPDQPS